MQYQALRKATGAVQGTAMDKVNRMAGVEDVPTYLDNCQARFIARCVEDPTKLGDIRLRRRGKPLWGGACQKVEIEEVDVRPAGGKDSQDDPKNPDA